MKKKKIRNHRDSTVIFSLTVSIALILITLVSLLILNNTKFIDNIVYPAYKSMQLDCNVNTNENVTLNNTNYVVAGKVTYNSSSNNITMTLYSPDESVRRHEMCHVRQLEKGKMFTCNNRPGIFLNELEAYLAEYYDFQC